MGNSKEWWSVSELLEKKVETLPKTDKGISKKADRENWGKRQRAGVKGKTFEYYVGDMPTSVQQALGFSVALPASPQPNRDDFVVTTPSGAEIGVELKAKRHSGNAGAGELMQAVQLIEQALAQIGKTPPPTQNDGLNNIERHLVRCFRTASEEGRVAILNIAETMAAMQEKKEESEPLENYQVV